MSYSRRQLYAMGEPLGEGATRRDVGGKVIYGGGGGGGTPANTTQTVTQELPAWARPYAKDSLAKAAALTDSPYQSYGGERIAQFTPLQQQAFQSSGQQQIAGQLGTGTGLATVAGARGLTESYQPGQFGAQMGQYMSPYMQGVVNQQMDSAQRQADIAATQRGAQAVKAGAFGGSRQAIENAEANRALASQKGQIQMQGLQSAYDRATDMYGREQSLAEQSRQAGLSNALTAAGQLGQLGQTQFGQQMGITEQQSQMGAQQRAATQSILDTQYQDFQNQQRAPYDQLAFMTSMIRGTPMGGTTAQYQTQAAPSTASQMIGLGTAAAGAYGAYQGAQGRAAGGEVHAYAAGGGIASLNPMEMEATARRMSDDQIKRVPNPPTDTAAVLARELALRDQMRDAAQPARPMGDRPTVAEEYRAGLASLEVPDDLVSDDGAANGGIVAFEGGGYVPFMQQIHNQREQKGSIYDPNFGLPPEERARREAAAAAAKAAERKANQIVLPANTPWQEVELARMQNPTQEVIVQRSGSGIADAVRSMNRNSDVDAKQRKEDTAKAAAMTPDEARKRASAATWRDAPSAAKATGDKAPTAAPRGEGSTRTTRADNTGIASALPKSIRDLQAQRRGEVEAAGKAGEQIEADKLAATLKDQEDLGPPGAEREKRVKAQEKALEGAEKKNLNMALIEAGLAIMAGDSANAFENIGKGALVGTKAYVAGMNRIQDRKEKLDESIMALDELRYGDKKANKKELREAEAGLNKAKQQTAAALAAVTGEDMKMAVDLYTKQLDRQATLAAASMRATSGERGELTQAKRAELADKAADNVRARLKDTPGAQFKTTDAEFNRLVDAELNRLLAAAGATSGGSAVDLSKWGKASAE
jgi:hypothetical protein